jgi:hypothetical protein
MLKSYSKLTDTKKTIEIPIDAVNIKYERILKDALSSKINFIKDDLFFIKGTLQIYAIRYFATELEKQDNTLEQRLLDVITDVVKELKEGTKEK